MKLLSTLFLILFIIMCHIDSFAQVYTMPAGTNTVSACIGSFQDSGGSASSYSNNESRTYTICPSSPGQVVSVTFSDFDTESGYDYLYIYNGNSTAAAQFTGSPFSGNGTINNTVFTSTAANGCLTFRFTSDGSYTYDGWVAEIRCGCPVFNLTAVGLSACSGTSPMTYTLNGTLTHQGGSGNLQLLMNGSPLGAAFPYTASPMAISLPGMTYTPPAPFIISAEDTGNPTACRSSSTVLVNAGNDVTLSCGLTSTTLTGSGPGTWSFVSGPATPTIVTPGSGTTNVTGMTTAGTYTLRRTNTVSGCTLYDDVVISKENCITMTNTTHNTCSGILLDPGGTGNYSNSTTRTTVICPTTGGNVMLHFTEFDTEEDNDFVTIHDGNSTAAPVIATYSGTQGLGQFISASNASGCLTVVFSSDGSIVGTGFKADIYCACRITINSVTPSACTGTPVNTFNLAINFSHGGGGSGVQVAINDVWVTGLIPYTASPQTINLTGLTHNTTDPLVIKVVDANSGTTCFSSYTIVNAGLNITEAICSPTGSTVLSAATAGTWSLASAPGGATVAIATPGALTTNVTGLTVLGDYVFNRTATLGGCTFRDRTTVSVVNCLNTSSSDVTGQCTGYIASHPTYPANYTNNYNENIVLCPPAGSVMQITFTNIALNATDDNDLIDVFFGNSTAGTPLYTLNRNDNGRSYSFASTSANGCITIRFRTNASNRGQGFLAEISCRSEDNVIRSPSCSGAPGLCMDGNNFFPSGTASGTGNTAIPMGCATPQGPSFFYFQASKTANLEFVITPTEMPGTDPYEAGADFDYAIWGPFSSTATIPCRTTPADNAGMGSPIRCNFAVAKGETGLSSAGVNTSEGVGGIRWCTPLPVTAGSFYVLMVDDYSRSGTGFNISSSTPDITNCSVILPVEWLNFDAEKFGENNRIFWNTAMERNNAYFEIEASTDGEKFQVIGQTEGGKGRYSFIHENPQSMVYYRVGQIDNDGTRTYTRIASVNREPKFFGSLACKPNPTNGNVEISFVLSQNSEVRVEVYSTTGVKVLEKITDGTAGVNQTDIDLSDFQSGLYLLRLSSDEGLMTAKLIKE